MRSITWVLLLSTFATIPFANAATFAYHGTLQDGGKPAEGKYDLELTLYPIPAGGSAIAGPLMLYAVPVHAGSFSTEADFGTATNIRNDAWLDVKVRPAGSGEFAALSGRSPVGAASTTSVCPGAWTLAGNAGNPAGSYLGTADAQPLIFQVNGAQAGKIANTGLGLNVVFGAATNAAAGAASFVTISGGDGNSAGDYSAVGGGNDNKADGDSSAIGGGYKNTTAGSLATIGGGTLNLASGEDSVVGGGNSNAAAQYVSTVAGGAFNNATGADAAIGGGAGNTASGLYSTVAGGLHNTAGGDFSFAGGVYALVRSASDVGGGIGDQGTFVWSDSTASEASPFGSTGPDQFLVHAAGGVGINTNALTSNQPSLTVFGLSSSRGTAAFESPKGPNLSHIHFGSNGDWFIRSAAAAGKVVIQDSGGITDIGNVASANATVILNVGGDAAKNNGGAWAALSDARLKQNIRAIEQPLERMLSLHGAEFEYIPGSHALETPGRKMGFIAQEVESVFPDWVGTGGDGYKYVSVHGFEAMSVEAVRELRAEKDAEIAALEKINAGLSARLDAQQGQLDAVLARLARLEADGGR